MSFLRRPMPSAIAAVVLTAAVAYAIDVAAQDLVATPVLPEYGEAIVLELGNTSWPM